MYISVSQDIIPIPGRSKSRTPFDSTVALAHYMAASNAARILGPNLQEIIVGLEVTFVDLKSSMFSRFRAILKFPGSWLKPSPIEFHYPLDADPPKNIELIQEFIINEICKGLMTQIIPVIDVLSPDGFPIIVGG